MSLNEPSTEKQYDINLLFVLFLFAVVSCFYIYEAQQMAQYDVNFMIRQLIFYVIAFGLVFAILHFDFEYYMNLHWVLYGIGLALLLGLEILGPSSIAPERNGAVAWYDLPIIGSFQPAEMMRIFLVLTWSILIDRHNHQYKERRNIKSDLLLLGKMGAVVAPVVILLERQPDLGSIMMIGAIFVSLMFVSGISYLLILLFVGVPVLLLVLFVFAFFQFPSFVETYLLSNLKDYQINRIYGWLNPFEYVDEGFQAVRAITAIGSGRLYGNHDSSIYIPEAHNDFIFAVIGETHGFLGTAFVITLYFVLMYQIMMIAMRCHNDFGTYICAGVLGMLAFQVFQNVGMNLGLLPVTGFNLPLISYGGSSLISTMIAIGMVLSVKYHSKHFVFEKKEN